ncbi:lysozyme [Paraburkholderia sp. Tr-20389]|uniref:lysozyme n=1 Tax=Paraburkholderia sp. Tr-20389 TaxID=2703903 RepID=UPI0019822BC5|nr:lysozyme [Paraburkholderia sp. Tr-20389]MBN3753690.1 lysozyme [Paraburkholderia sp. Tr-20389]
MAQPRPVDLDTINLVKCFEGIPGLAVGDIHPYMDPVGIWTIGWGHAISVDGQFLRGSTNLNRVKALYPDGISLNQADALLATDLMQAGSGVLSVVTVALNNFQYGALSSFVMNLGLANLRSSTLLKEINANQMQAAANQFPRWCYAQGKFLKGLLDRRNAERALFLK